MDNEKVRIAKELLEAMEFCAFGRDFMSFNAEQLDAVGWLIEKVEEALV